MPKRFETRTNKAGNFGYSEKENAWLAQNYFDTSWLTPEIARDINRRLDNNCRPIIFMETNRYDTSIYHLISKRASYLQRTRDAEVYLKNTLLEKDGFTQLIIYLTGKDKDIFYKEFNLSDINQIIPKLGNSAGLTRIFWIDSNLNLWNFKNASSYRIFQDAHTRTIRAPEFAAPQSDAQQSEPTAQTAESDEGDDEEIQRPIEQKPKKPCKSLSQIIAENRAKPRKLNPNSKVHTRLIPSYEKKFASVLARYGQSFDALLLPMSEAETALYYARLAELRAEQERQKTENATQQVSQSPQKNKRGRPSTLAKMTPEELAEYKRANNRRYHEQRKEREAAYLETLTPEQREAYLEEKRAVDRKRQAEYYQRCKEKREAMKQAMTPEELKAYEEQEEIKKEEERRKNRERNARRRAKAKAEQLALKEQEERERQEREQQERDKVAQQEAAKAAAKKSAEIRAKVAKRKAERNANSASTAQNNTKTNTSSEQSQERA